MTRLIGSYRRCPGCGDLGDIDHVVACCGALGSRVAHAVASELDTLLIQVINKQLKRRGALSSRAVSAAFSAARRRIESRRRWR